MRVARWLSTRRSLEASRLSGPGSSQAASALRSCRFSAVPRPRRAGWCVVTAVPATGLRPTSLLFSLSAFRSSCCYSCWVTSAVVDLSLVRGLDLRHLLLHASFSTASENPSVLVSTRRVLSPILHGSSNSRDILVRFALFNYLL